jgi:nicotinate-nucleotide pyrophosphorylase (carboxylating)
VATVVTSGVDEKVSKLINLALEEDIGTGDVTSEFFVPEERKARAFVVAKSVGVVFGVKVAAEVFKRVDAGINVNFMLLDGTDIAPGAYVMEVVGMARSLLTAERTAINFLQRLSGVATKAHEFVELVKGTGATIIDTRKTTPGWRKLEKAAVVAGGAQNHRMGLYDRAMVKDNHLVVEGGVETLRDAMLRLKEAHPGVDVEVEAETLEQVEAFLALDGLDYLLLDNMENEQMKRAVEMRGTRDRPLFEASGGVNLDTVRGIAQTGVEYISVGALTHSAAALDISLEFVAFEEE